MWDVASKNRGVISATWDSEFLFEEARFSQKDAIALFADLAKFYGLVGRIELIADATHCEFPVRLLFTTIFVYASPRKIVQLSAVGPWIVPSQSVLAGCARAVSMIRTFFYHVVLVVKADVPSLFIREYVDDLVLAAASKGDQCVGIVQQGASLLLDQLASKRARISPKTVIVASRRELGQILHCLLYTSPSPRD